MPPPKFKRLTIGGEVRLMGAYIVKCESVEKNPDGSIAAIHCTADLETGNGNPADGRKVKGTIHWVSADHAVDAEVRLYDKLFTEANMNAIPEGSDYKDYLNPESVVVRKGCKLEESLEGCQARREVPVCPHRLLHPGQQEPWRVQPRGHPARQLQACKVNPFKGVQTDEKHLIRNAILMAVATLIMGVFLSLYIANTGTVPAADNAAASTASSQAAQ